MNYYTVSYSLLSLRYTRSVLFGSLEDELSALFEIGAGDIRIEGTSVD